MIIARIKYWCLGYVSWRRAANQLQFWEMVIGFGSIYTRCCLSLLKDVLHHKLPDWMLDYVRGVLLDISNIPPSQSEKSFLSAFLLPAPKQTGEKAASLRLWFKVYYWWHLAIHAITKILAWDQPTHLFTKQFYGFIWKLTECRQRITEDTRQAGWDRIAMNRVESVFLSKYVWDWLLWVSWDQTNTSGLL